MIKWIVIVLLIFSVLFGIINNNMDKVTTSVLESCQDSVELAISLIGVICLWSGIMRVADSAGLTIILSKLFKPILSKIFKGINSSGKAMGYIVMNLTSNLLGLGNASTPLGISAIKELEKEEKTNQYASNNMILLVVMNTASLQIIPTTVAALRLRNSSSAPMEILPVVWIVSGCAIVLAVFMCKIIAKISKDR